MFPFFLFSILLVAFFGACIGSFLSVCIYRIPRGESIVRPRSHCQSCGKLIPWYFNIPILSWIMLGGKCRYCRARISPRYVVLELLTAALFTLAFLQAVPGIGLQMAFARGITNVAPEPMLGMVVTYPPALLFVYWLIIFGLIFGSYVDLDYYILPDRVTIGGIVAGFAVSAIFPQLHFTNSIAKSMIESSIGFFAGVGILWLISILGSLAFKKEAMGFGDVKLMGAVGAFFGWKAVLFVLFVSAFLGSIAGIGLVLCGKRELKGRIPFGPFIALATLIWMFWGPPIMDAYIRFLARPMA